MTNETAADGEKVAGEGRSPSRVRGLRTAIRQAQRLYAPGERGFV